RRPRAMLRIAVRRGATRSPHNPTPRIDESTRAELHGCLGRLRGERGSPVLERRRASVPILTALFLSVSALSASAFAGPDHLVCRRTRETGPGAIRSADV